MASSAPDNKPNGKFSFLNVTLAVVAGQVGCLTLVIVLVAVLGGLWLDNRFQTKPAFTLILVLASIPISVLAMLAVVRSAVSRIKTANGTPKSTQQEETGVGRDENS
jgi:F0F1-type ATP synthase assembly protein I